jgi:Capsule assembly protein Wzi
MRLIVKFLLIYTFFVLSQKNIFSQRENTYSAELSGIVGTEQTPFWMRANKYGLVPTKANTAILSIGTYSDYQKPKSKIDWGYGLNVAAFVGMENKAIIQEAYIKGKWRAFEFYGGRRKEIQGLVDSTLSSGSYIWSGNAFPIPKLQISIPDYTSIGGEGLIAIKGNYAHGWFENNRKDASNIYLHQKSFYGRIGKQNWKFKLYGGVNHQAQWGGFAKYKDVNQTNAVGSFGTSFKDYLGVFMAKSNVGEDTTGVDQNSSQNRTGNHLGSIDLGFEIRLSKAEIFFYRQSIFEDGSLFYLNNISDGLQGINIKFNQQKSNKLKVYKINFEFLNTLNQGGPISASGGVIASKRGRDDYFNNGQYRDGWSYYGTSVGTPFFLAKSEFPQKKNDPNNPLLFSNNRVQVYHFAINGIVIDKYSFESRVSISKNWGTYSLPFQENILQTSFYLKIDSQLNQILGGINVFGILAGDVGEVLSSNYAIQFGIKKSWSDLPFLSHPTHKHTSIH